MGSRADLQKLLELLLESRNVYFQPPDNVDIKYPCIRFEKSDIKTTFANNLPYTNITQYQIIVIDHHPENPVIQKLMKLPMTTFDRHYNSNSLNHDVITIYY